MASVNANPNDYSRQARCHICLLGPGLCVCQELDSIELPYRFIIIRHRSEIGCQSNTGGIASRLVAGTVLLDHGCREGPFDPAPLHKPNTDYCLLYPGPDATELTPDFVQRSSSLVFVVLDGSWPKARRMTQRISALHGIAKVALPGRPQGASLRKPHGPQRFFTLEAMARVIDTLGPADQAEVLRNAMSKVMSRRLHERGKIPRRDVV